MTEELRTRGSSSSKATCPGQMAIPYTLMDDAEHTLFMCPAWVADRPRMVNTLKAQVNEDKLGMVISPMLGSGCSVFQNRHEAKEDAERVYQ